MQIIRVLANWTGFPGAPGYSSFHFSSDGGFWDGGILGDGAQVAAQAAADRVISAFNECAAYFPKIVRIRTDPEVSIIDSDTGETLGAVDIDGDTVAGIAPNDDYAGPTGAVVNWRTNDYRFGRRIRGRTFLVPIAGSSYDSDGTLGNAALQNIRAFGEEMVGSSGGPEFGVWSRPRDGEGGVFATVTNSSVPDKAVVLRSRRD